METFNLNPLYTTHHPTS